MRREVVTVLVIPIQITLGVDRQPAAFRGTTAIAHGRARSSDICVLAHTGADAAVPVVVFKVAIDPAAAMHVGTVGVGTDVDTAVPGGAGTRGLRHSDCERNNNG